VRGVRRRGVAFRFRARTRVDANEFLQIMALGYTRHTGEGGLFNALTLKEPQNLPYLQGACGRTRLFQRMRDRPSPNLKAVHL